MEGFEVNAICYKRGTLMDATSDAIQRQYHVGIVVYGFLYESGNDGIKKSDASDKDRSAHLKSCYTSVNISYRKFIGTTQKTIFEFDKWCHMVRDIFKNERIDMWIKEACSFLGILDNLSWESMSELAEIVQPTSAIEAVCWDITYGFAESGIGRKILQFAAPAGLTPPNGVYHVGIVAFGYLYEYGTQGISKIALKSISDTVDLTSFYNTNSMKYRIYMGQTKASLQEFDIWCKRMGKQEFSPSLYSTSLHNCVNWAKRACNELEVPYPSDWNNICAIAESNGLLVKLTAATGRSSGRSSTKPTPQQALP